jgi:hypothetical protein
MDIYQYFGNDIVMAANGDLQTIDGIEKGKQRILRRLMTIPGSYIFHVNYGAGLPLYVGEALTQDVYQKILGVILTQLQLEQAVSKETPPVVKLQAIPDGLIVDISYTDAGTLTPQVLTFVATK